MKILHVDTGLDLRGGQYQLLMLLRGLKAQGHEQTLLARGDMARAWPSSPPTAAALWRLSRTVDIVHAHDGRGHTLAALSCWRTPFVVSRRVAFPVKTGLLSRFKYSRARMYLAVSEHVQGVLLQSGIPPEKISVVYDAVDREDIIAAPTGNSPRSSEQPLRVVTPRIDDRLKRSDLVEQACKKLGAEVILSTDLRRDIDRADVFVYLSESEGLGSAALLAMARGKPVIASRVGGLPEIVIDESAGLLVDNDVDSVVGALKRMSSDQELAGRCVGKAFQRLSAQFTDDIMVRRTEEAYRSVMRNPKSTE